MDFQEHTDNQNTARKVNNLRHIQTIADKMSPDPKEWSYLGEFHEAGETPEYCACGHLIKQVFVIRRGRDNATLNIGSTCISSTVPYLLTCGAEELSKALQDALRRLEEDRREHARRLRQAEASVLVTNLDAEYEELRAYRRGCQEKFNSVWMPTILWSGLPKVKVSKTAAITANNIRTRYADLWLNLVELIIEGWDTYNNCCTQVHLTLPSNIPAPKDSKLREKIRTRVLYRIDCSRKNFGEEQAAKTAVKCQKILSLLGETQ